MISVVQNGDVLIVRLLKIDKKAFDSILIKSLSSASCMPEVSHV